MFNFVPKSYLEGGKIYLNLLLRSRPSGLFTKAFMDQTYELIFRFSQEDVEAFAKLTGDDNPLHLDAEFAATTTFKRPIMHGMLAASVFTRVLGTIFPGHGSIYLGQTLEFLRPMYVDTDYKATFKITEVNQKKHSAKVETHIYTTDRNKITLKGEATIMNTEIFV